MDVDYGKNFGEDGNFIHDFKHSLHVLTTVQSVTVGFYVVYRYTEINKNRRINCCSVSETVLHYGIRAFKGEGNDWSPFLTTTISK